jgi:ABC-type uncharacterized transport system ATPase subunit
VSLVVDSITKRFGDVVALDNASFTVEPGRIFGLLGANRVLMYGQRVGIRNIWRATRVSR